MNRLYILLVIIALSSFSCKEHEHSVLIEAESFLSKGGWLVDPQFVEQMGSPYLIAHGLGKPVADAETKAAVSEAGKYHVWVRTMNWAPGNWLAPGRFRIAINERVLENELGTREDWGWQYAELINIKDTTFSLKLQDLTGFDGRCDAIFLSTERKSPPDDIKDLKVWRKNMTGESEAPSVTESFDLVVVGGGIAGCAASVAARSPGCNAHRANAD